MQTFHPFPRLPQEIQIQIWSFAIHPRTLTIVQHPPWPHIIERLCSPDPIPSVMHVCQASRAEGLRFYRPAFHFGTDSRFIWANFEYDTIHISCHALAKMDDDERAQIRWGVVDIDDQVRFFAGNDIACLYTLRSIDELDILSGEPLRNFSRILMRLRDGLEFAFGDTRGYQSPIIRIWDKDDWARDKRGELHSSVSGYGSLSGSLPRV